MKIVDVTPDEEATGVVDAAFEVVGARMGVWWPGGCFPPTIFFGQGRTITRHGFGWSAQARWDRERTITGWVIEDAFDGCFTRRKTPIRVKPEMLGEKIAKTLTGYEAMKLPPDAGKPIGVAIAAMVHAFRTLEERGARR